MMRETQNQVHELDVANLSCCQLKMARRIWAGIVFLAGTFALVACSTDDAAGDSHHSDTPAVDARAGDGADDTDAMDDVAGEDAIDDDSATGPCSDPCRSDQVCCVDQHGHFPRCVDGSYCPPPLQPPPDA